MMARFEPHVTAGQHAAMPLCFRLPSRLVGSEAMRRSPKTKEST